MTLTTKQTNPQTIVQEVISAAEGDKREQPWREVANEEVKPASEAAAVAPVVVPAGTGPAEKVKVGGVADVQQLFFE